MNKIIILSFVVIVSCTPVQRGIVDLEQYNSYQLNIYYDNIHSELIPQPLWNNYYENLSGKDFLHKEQIIDTTNQTRSVIVITKSAKKGYLYINKSVSNYMERENLDTSNFKIKYQFEKQEVLDENGVNNLISLKKIKDKDKDIVITTNLELGIIEVKINK